MNKQVTTEELLEIEFSMRSERMLLEKKILVMGLKGLGNNTN
jgi:hypothetical protein